MTDLAKRRRRSESPIDYTSLTTFFTQSSRVTYVLLVSWIDRAIIVRQKRFEPCRSPSFSADTDDPLKLPLTNRSPCRSHPSSSLATTHQRLIAPFFTLE